MFTVWYLPNCARSLCLKNWNLKCIYPQSPIGSQTKVELNIPHTAQLEVTFCWIYFAPIQFWQNCQNDLFKEKTRIAYTCNMQQVPNRGSETRSSGYKIKSLNNLNTLLLIQYLFLVPVSTRKILTSRLSIYLLKKSLRSFAKSEITYVRKTGHQ